MNCSGFSSSPWFSPDLGFHVKILSLWGYALFSLTLVILTQPYYRLWWWSTVRSLAAETLHHSRLYECFFSSYSALLMAITSIKINKICLLFGYFNPCLLRFPSVLLSPLTMILSLPRNWPTYSFPLFIPNHLNQISLGWVHSYHVKTGSHTISVIVKLMKCQILLFLLNLFIYWFKHSYPWHVCVSPLKMMLLISSFSAVIELVIN